MRLTHAFTPDEIAEAARSGAPAIVGHGTSLHVAGYERTELALEYAPVYVSAALPVKDVTLVELAAVLSGEIHAHDATGVLSSLRLYLHGAELQRRKFLNLLSRLRIELRTAVSKPTYGSDYADLEARAASDPRAVVLGLKTISNPALRRVSIGGAHPMSSRPAYPLTLPIFLHHRGEEGLKALHALRSRLADEHARFIAS
jgi:hypothetical protein